MKKLAKIGLSLALVLGFSACSNNNSTSTSSQSINENLASVSSQSTEAENFEKPEVIKVGVVGEKNEVWDNIKEEFEKNEGIKLELVTFSDYNQPNQALADGSIDLNAFQHETFLNEFRKSNKDLLDSLDTDLVPVGYTYFPPMGLYSDKIKDISELEDGATIAIPDDPTNEARGLFLLQANGIIEVEGEPGQSITLDQITSNPKNLKFEEVDASQVARLIEDPKVSAAIVTNSFAVEAGLNPKEDSIILEKLDDNAKPYINVFAVRKEDKDNPWIQKIIKDYYQTDESEQILLDTTANSIIVAW